MLVAVATVALTARQAAPPTVAEFAPSDIEQIKDPPPIEGDALSGPGSGGRGGTAATTTTSVTTPDGQPSAETTTTTIPPIDEPRVRRCIGQPPRQTEDPQSPPCVNYFDGDNGGATAKGVTADEIRVAYPPIGFGEDETLTADMVAFFNKRYEFYGRRIVLKRFDATGGGFNQPDPSSMQADAVKVDKEFDAFASLAYPDRKGAEHHYFDELARRGVVSVAYRAQALASQDHYREFAPYQWNALPPVETMMRLFGVFVCNTLAGQPPRYAGTPTNGAATRRFGLLYQRTPDGTIPQLGNLRSALAACGVDLGDRVFEDSSTATNANNAMIQFSSKNVTSVLCVCIGGLVRDNYMPAATNQAFFPEWVLSGYLDQDLDNSFQAAPAEQAHIIGQSYRSKLLPRQDASWYAAVKEIRPERDPSGGIYYAALSRYHQLALLAAGVQMAGPNLTPETFQAGLHKAAFPNTGAGQAPNFAARVGFPGGRHTMTDDATMFWYSLSDNGTVDPSFPGAVCYVNGGARFTATSWPKGEQPFFSGPCHR